MRLPFAGHPSSPRHRPRVVPLLGALLLAALAPARAQADLPYHGSLELRPRLPVLVESVDGATRVRIGRGRPLEVTVPGVAHAAQAEVVTLAGGRRLGVVEVQGERRHAIVVDAVRGRPRLRWSGELDWRGDPGERRRDVLLIEDRTGDGHTDLIVGVEEEGRRVCGQPPTILSARAVDPRTGELRSVTLRRLPADETEPVVTAAREERAAPLLRALVPASVSSQAGAELPGPPIGLTDDDPTTGWVEGRPGPGRWEFATLRWGAPFPIHGVTLTVGLPGTSPPRTLWLVHEAGRVRVQLPDASPGTWWVPLPAPVRSRCLSIVLDEADGEADHVALAEVRAYTDLDAGGVEALVDRLAGSGPGTAQTVRLLATIGEPALRELAARWDEMPSAERRLASRVFAARLDTELGREGLLRAARDGSPELRSAAVEAAVSHGSAEVLALLLDSLLDLGDGASDEVALALARRHPQAAVEPLLAALTREGAADRPALREALRTAYQRGSHDEQRLRGWLEAAPGSARAAVALALARGGETLAPLAREAFRAATTHEGSFVERWRLLQAAGRLGPDAAVDAWVARMASAPEWMIRAAALEALAARGVAQRATVARRALQDEYPRVRIAALRTLANAGLRGRDVERVAFRARRDPWPMVRAAAVDALVPARRARRILVAALDDPSPVVRAAAVDALRVAEDDAAWPMVRARLEDDREWPVVLRAAIRFARQRCRPDAIAPLGVVVERALRPEPWTPDVAVAAEALAAAAAIGRDESAALLGRAAGPTAPAPLRNAAEAATEARTCRPEGRQAAAP